MPSNTEAQQPTKCAPVRFKTSLCRTFDTTGSCPYANRCMFAHGAEELRTPEMNVREGITTHDAIRVLRRKYRRAQRDRTAKSEGKSHAKSKATTVAEFIAKQGSQDVEASSEDQPDRPSEDGAERSNNSSSARTDDTTPFIYVQSLDCEKTPKGGESRFLSASIAESPLDDFFGASDTGSTITSSIAPERWYRHDPYGWDAIERIQR